MSGTGLLGAVGERLSDRVLEAARVGGGSISRALRLRMESGRSVFLKAREGAGPEEFEAEAAGLRWLAEPGALELPEVLGVGAEPAWLALEWIEPGTAAGPGEERLGRGLAELHRSGAEAWGALPPGSPDGSWRIASLELGEAGGGGWPGLYAGARLEPLLAMAVDRGAIDGGGAAAVRSVCDRIESLCGPEEPIARLHGDLWGGNVLAGRDGGRRLIDPAAYGGHREVDLAMLELFGDPGSRFRGAYEEAWPLAEGHRERVGLWQLLPLLVHAVLFGGSYGARAGAVARTYG